MKPALFVFADDIGSSCVFVRECNHDKAYKMIARTISHKWAPKLEHVKFNADEYSALFIAANKRAPFDMYVTGELDETGDDYEDVEAVYEVAPTRDGRAVSVLPVTNGEETSTIWLLKQISIH